MKESDIRFVKLLMLVNGAGAAGVAGVGSVA